MSDLDILSNFPSVSRVMEWYLKEIAYCLEQYLNLNTADALDKMISAEHFRYIVANHPHDIERETAFYWAMHIQYGAKWWNDKELVDQHVTYIRSGRHHPPEQ
jgi:hypothetical protein